jgi:hypothetical protein
MTPFPFHPYPAHTQAPRLELIEIHDRINGASAVEAAGAVMAVALSRPRPVDASGQPVGTLLVDLVGMNGHNDGYENVSAVAIEAATHTLAFVGRGEWAEIRFRR